MAAGAAVVGATAFAGGVAGNTERVTRYWSVAAVGDDGSAGVTEMIDYEFGPSFDKHGIYRDVPGLDTATPITVSSPGAPDDVLVTPEADGVRTAAGSALWLRIESFRRFLAGSEAYHAEEAAKRGVLREYTAWAVAVGEIDRWKRAVAAASIAPEVAGVHYAYMAPMLMASTATAATAPSSSGGGFGSVGGGAGGGGGGSW